MEIGDSITVHISTSLLLNKQPTNKVEGTVDDISVVGLSMTIDDNTKWRLFFPWSHINFVVYRKPVPDVIHVGHVDNET